MHDLGVNCAYMSEGALAKNVHHAKRVQRELYIGWVNEQAHKARPVILTQKILWATWGSPSCWNRLLRPSNTLPGQINMTNLSFWEGTGRDKLHSLQLLSLGST